jgi:hypothetical protein
VYPFTLDEFGSFDEQVRGGKTFDYDVDGMAHVGLLPDVVADLSAIAVNGADLDPLFRPAEEYIRMWELARRRPARRLRLLGLGTDLLLFRTAGRR